MYEYEIVAVRMPYIYATSSSKESDIQLVKLFGGDTESVPEVVERILDTCSAYYFLSRDGYRVNIEISYLANGTPYIRSKSNGQTIDTLLDLPKF